jgi:ribosomal protein S18 acetylase RimI-like enzyme
VELRAPRKQDAPAIVEATHRWGYLDETVPDIEAWFDMPSIDIERNGRVVLHDGVVTAYGDIGDRSGDGKILWLDARADVDAMPVLLDFLEGRARELASEGAKLKVWSPEQNANWRALLEARGYEIDHYSFRMWIDLDRDLPEPDWPEAISVRTYCRDEDEQAVYETHQETFSDQHDYERDPFDEWQQWSYREPFDPELWFLALDGDELAGVLFGRGERGGDTSLGWVSVLGVRRPWRGRGLGRALLQHAFGELRRRGKVRAGLGVDAGNASAVRLYQRAGMTKEQAFVWYRRDL